MQPIDESYKVKKFHRLNAEAEGRWNTYACHELGFFYADGRGDLPRNGFKAKSWFSRCISAADNEYTYIHKFLENKDMTYEESKVEARKLLPEKFDKYQVGALVQIYWIEKNTRDLDEIFDIVYRAKGGDAAAQYELGDLFLNANDKYFIPLFVRMRDGGEWMEKAAKQGYSKAYEPLALYYRGADIPSYDDHFRDKEAAFYWAEQAFKANPEEEWYELARHYYMGRAVEKDIQKYIEVLETSGDLGFAMSCLGRLFLDGQKVPVDVERAAKYFAQSNNQETRERGEQMIEEYYNSNPEI